MWRHLLYVLPLVSSTTAIIVPVDNNEQNATEIIPVNRDQGQKTNIFYISDDANVDSYLIPPDPHKPAEPLSDVIVTPATYLLPPAQDRQSEYYVPEGTGEQSEWLPIQVQSRPEVLYQRQPKAILPIFLNLNYTGAYQAENLPVPSTYLEPPSVDAVNEFITSDETDLPTDGQNQAIIANYNLPYSDMNTNVPENYQLNPVEPTLAIHLLPPKLQVQKTPTNLYPKKYSGGFQPLPIPVAQFAEDDLLRDPPKAKPVKYLKPQPIVETDELPALDEKKLYRYTKADHQRKLKGEDGPTQPHQLADGAVQETHGGPTPTEQQTSETNFRYPGRNTYPAKIRQSPAPNALRDPAAPAPDGRTEFRMHGMKGPHSYQFGFDTGKGKNRQFRYEERDNDGLVQGHYGYMDKYGKLRVVNYSAHPEYGFHAEEPKEKE